MAGRIVATEAALAALERPTASYGPLVVFQSGGCCDGGSPICLRDGELPPGPHGIHFVTRPRRPIGGSP